MKSFDLRNGELFLRDAYYGAGEYGMPVVYRQDIDLDNLEFLGYHNTKPNDERNAGKTIHFFLDDRKFEGVWNAPDRSLEKLRQYRQVLSPDFSVYTNMPLAVQVWNTFRRRWVSAFWQEKGLTVIPCVTWGDERSYAFCFDGIEQGSVVAVSTLGSKRYFGKAYLKGYEEMKRRLDPAVIICYSTPLPEMEREVIAVPYERRTVKARTV